MPSLRPIANRRRRRRSILRPADLVAAIRAAQTQATKTDRLPHEHAPQACPTSIDTGVF